MYLDSYAALSDFSIVGGVCKENFLSLELHLIESLQY